MATVKLVGAIQEMVVTPGMPVPRVNKERRGRLESLEQAILPVKPVKTVRA